MEFNDYYLEQVENKDLAKLILFALKENISLADYLHGNPISIKEELTTEANKILSVLYKADKIELDYSKDPRVSLKREIYVNVNQKFEFDVNEYRKYWSANVTGQNGKMGDTNYVRNKIEELLQLNPDITFEKICNAASRYVADCMHTDRMMKDADNFLSDRDGKQLILAWLDDKSELKPSEKMI